MIVSLGRNSVSRRTVRPHRGASRPDQSAAVAIGAAVAALLVVAAFGAAVSGASATGAAVFGAAVSGASASGVAVSGASATGAAVSGAAVSGAAPVGRSATAESLAAGGPAPAAAASTEDLGGASHWEEISAACGTDNPYYVTTRFDSNGGVDKDTPVVLAFRDTLCDNFGDDTWVGCPYLPLAAFGDVGHVWGLAYDWQRAILYAGGYFKELAWGVDTQPDAGWILRLDVARGVAAPLVR